MKMIPLTVAMRFVAYLIVIGECAVIFRNDSPLRIGYSEARPFQPAARNSSKPTRVPGGRTKAVMSSKKLRDISLAQGRASLENISIPWQLAAYSVLGKKVICEDDGISAAAAVQLGLDDDLIEVLDPICRGIRSDLSTWEKANVERVDYNNAPIAYRIPPSAEYVQGLISKARDQLQPYIGADTINIISELIMHDPGLRISEFDRMIYLQLIDGEVFSVECELVPVEGDSALEGSAASVLALPINGPNPRYNHLVGQEWFDTIRQLESDAVKTK